MEIALWTTFLTTIITVLQTVLMWYFTKHVELDDEETVTLAAPPEIDQVTKEYVDSQMGIVVNGLEPVLNRIDEGEKLSLQHESGANERIEALQELSVALIDIIDSMSKDIEDLKADAEHWNSNVENATTILSNALPVNEFAHHTTPPDINPYAHQSPPQVNPAIRSTRPGPPRPEPAQPRQMRVPEELLMDELPPQQSDHGFSEVPDSEPTVSEDILKPVRQDGDPMIMDLRATPFEEAQDAYGNIHDLQSGDGFELWGEKGKRSPRNRGFRRI